MVQTGHVCGTLQSGVRAEEGALCEGMEGVPLGSVQDSGLVSHDDTYHKFVPSLSGSTALGKMLQLNLPQHLLPPTQLIGWQPQLPQRCHGNQKPCSQPLGCETIGNSVCMCTCVYACAHSYTLLTHVGTIGVQQFLLYTLKIQTQTRIMKLKASNICLSESTPRPNMFLYNFICLFMVTYVPLFA